MQEVNHLSAAKFLRTLGATLIMVGLAAVATMTIMSGDFAYTWQPVPKEVPGREVLARLTGALLLAGVLGAFAPAIRLGALRLLLGLMCAWLLLHLPAVFARPLQIGAWIGLAEIGTVTLGVWTMFLQAQGSAKLSRPWIFRLFGAAAIVFGSAHFAYPEITAGLVPSWIPDPLFWAYATGIGHLLGGIALLIGFRQWLAATALGAMYLSWVFILHGERVLVAPTSRLEWTMLFVASMISGAAFLVASLGLGPALRGHGADRLAVRD